MSISSLPPETADDDLWLVWYVTWILAVVFSARTATQMRNDIGGLPRAVFGLGLLLLFVPPQRRTRW